VPKLKCELLARTRSESSPRSDLPLEVAISNDPLNLWILVPLGRWTLLSDRSFELPASFQSTHYYQLVIVAAQVLFTPANSTLVTVILLATLLASAPGRRARDCTLGGVESGPAQIYLTELD
jgi:hypothetical protein